MQKSLLFIALAAALAAGAAYADQSKPKIEIPLKPTTPVSGKQMYVNYCAPCHGMDGRGRGPVAAALKEQPVDLTVMSKNDGGKYPSAHIISVLEYGSTIPSHGTAQMPVWGPILGRMNPNDPSQRALRIRNLNRFLETIQAK